MRSKTLLVSNILSTIYATVLLYGFCSRIIASGWLAYITYYYQQYFNLAYEMVGDASLAMNIVYAIIMLLFVHIVTFTFGVLFGWIGYSAKKSGTAKFAATLYLIGTICFPFYIVFGLPLIIIGYVGGGKQKKLNTESVTLN